MLSLTLVPVVTGVAGLVLAGFERIEGPDPAAEFEFGFCESAPRQPPPETTIAGAHIHMPRYGEIEINGVMAVRSNIPHHNWHAGAVWAERIDHSNGTIIRHIWDDCVDLIVGQYFLLSTSAELVGSGSGLVTHNPSGFFEDDAGVVFWNAWYCRPSEVDAIEVKVLSPGATDFVASTRPRAQVCSRLPDRRPEGSLEPVRLEHRAQ